MSAVRKGTLIAGDGIGPEVVAATVRVIEATGVAIKWETQMAGAMAIAIEGTPLPQKTLDSIRKTGLALKGPTTTPIGGGHASINVALRKTLDLYANVRPIKTLPGVKSRYDHVDLVIVRENTEDLYAGVEHYIDPRRTAAESIAIITKFGSERCIVYAFEYARKHGRKKITLVHKANILKMSNGLFLDTGKEVAKRYPDIEFNDMIVDATAMKLVISPERFDMIVTMNLFGDILSDLTAGLVGGLGVAPAANIGDGGCAMFEAVHGTANDIAGRGIANPTGLMLSAAMLLDHVEQREPAERLRKGIWAALANAETRTGDLGGKTNTAGYTDAVIRLMR